MAETIIIDPANVRAGATELLTAKAAFDTAITTLSESVGSYGAETWGRDSYGKEFADGEKGYRSSRGNLLRGGREMVGTVEDFGDGLLQAAHSADAADLGSSRAF
ncbi:hypothetical protein [Nocardia sp. NPDC052566]|uniref:hypothetical protein n=1 Tax=Nocardia sp. NPDC052566 TaxID=3364330 RepID=UPI0037C620B8